MNDANRMTEILGAELDEDPQNILVKKVFKVAENQWFHETTIFDPKTQTAHSKCHTLGNHVIGEDISHEERRLRKLHWHQPELISFSQYWRKLANGRAHVSIMEQSYRKEPCHYYDRFISYFKRRDAYTYLKSRWAYN